MLGAVERGVHLRQEGGKKFSHEALDSARHFYRGAAVGHWQPSSMMACRDVLLLGSGPGVKDHQEALEQYIRKAIRFSMSSPYTYEGKKS